MKYLETQICHRCLSCKTVALLLGNAIALAETFAHMETLPRVAVLLIKIQVVKCLLLILGTLSSRLLTVSHGLLWDLVPEMN